MHLSLPLPLSDKGANAKPETGNTERGELSRTLPTPFFLRLDTYQKKFEPNYLQAEFIFGKSE